MRVVSAAGTDVINGFFLGNLGQHLRQDGCVANGVVGDFNGALYRTQFVRSADGICAAKPKFTEKKLPLLEIRLLHNLWRLRISSNTKQHP